MLVSSDPPGGGLEWFHSWNEEFSFLTFPQHVFGLIWWVNGKSPFPFANTSIGYDCVCLSFLSIGKDQKLYQ